MAVMRALGASMLVLAVAACNGGDGGNNNAAAQGNQATKATATSNAQRAVSDLPEGQRNGVLFRAIRDARQPCQHVEQSDLIETPNSIPVYMATCEDRTVYAVVVRDDGMMIVKEAMREKGKE